LKRMGIPDDLLYINESVFFAANMKCIMKAWKVLLLTATPVINGVQDLTNIFYMLTKRKPGRISLATLPRLLNSVGISYYETPKTIASGYPNYNIRTVELTMVKKEFQKYEEAYREHADEKRMIFFNHMRAAGDSCFLIYYSPKIDFIEKFLALHRKKTLIYSFWIQKGINLITNMLRNKGIDVSIITGKTQKKKRTKIISDFNKTDFSVLLITAAGKEGIDLKGVRYVFLLEPGWNQAAEHQALSRAVRFNSHTHLPIDEQNVVVYRLLLANSVDTELLTAYVQGKQQLTEQINILLQQASIT